MKLRIFLAIVCGAWSLAHAADPNPAGKPAKAATRGKAPAIVSSEDIQRLEALAPTKAAAIPAKPRKVLIFCKVTGWRPPAIPLVNKMYEILGMRTGAYEIAAISEDPAIFTPEKLKDFDAVIMNNCNELQLDESQSRALQDFVKNGKGVVGLGSTISIRNWPEEAEMMGGYCFRHPFSGQPLNRSNDWALKIEDPSHPLTKMFDPRGFKSKDVMYQIVGPYSRDKMRILLSLDMNDPRTGAVAEIPGSVNRTLLAFRPDKDFGIAWIRNYGEGRVFFSLLTHARGDMVFDTAMLQHFLDGLQFALGDLQVDASPNPLSTGAATKRPSHVEKTPARWAALLSDTNADTRIEAALALGDLGTKAETSILALVTILKGDAADVRIFAAKAIGKLGAPAIPGVAPLLQDTNPAVRAAAVQALGNIGPAAKTHAPALAALIQDKDPTVQTEAILALGKIGPEVATTVPTLIQLLTNKVPAIQAAAFDALRSMGAGARDALPALTAILQGPPDAEERGRGGFYTIGARMDALPTVSAMCELPEARDAIVAATTLFRGRDVQGICPALVFQVMGPHAAPAVPALTSLLQDTNAITRGYVAMTLGWIGSPAEPAIPALARQLDDPDSFARVSAAEALGELGPRAIQSLIAALKHKDWLVRVKGADGLGRMGAAAKVAVQDLTVASRDKDSEVRRSAAAALARVRPQQ